VRHQGSIIRCAECGTKSNELATGWRAYLVGDFDEEENEEEVLVFCPECASRGTGSGLGSGNIGIPLCLRPTAADLNRPVRTATRGSREELHHLTGPTPQATDLR
jgi:hypothetical protein